MKKEVAFIGAGRMASAMVGGLVHRKVYAPGALICTGANDGTPEALAEKCGIAVTYDPAELLAEAGVVVLAFKPQQLKDIDSKVLNGIRGKLVVSILAGTPIAKLNDVFPGAGNIVRSMPNTPGQIGAGITAYASRDLLSDEQRTVVENLLGALGEVHAVAEKDIDAVTGVSGSGPAYVFEFVAGLRDAGIQAGLDPELAYRLALQTTLGASKLLVEVPETPEQHRDWVSSPGGTTLAGLKVMSDRNFRAILHDTVAAATRRSRELAEG